MQFRFSQGGFKNYRLSKIHGFTLVELLVIIAILAILTVVGFLLLGNTTTTARDSQRIANIRQLHDATRLQAASLHTLPMPYQAVPISIGGGSGTIDLTASGATSQYAVFVDGSTQLSTLTGSRLLALARDGGVDTLLAGGTLSGAVSNQNLGWQGYADASIAGSLNYSDTVDPQDQTLFTYRLGQNRDRSQFLAYLENPENENSTPLLWNIADPVNAATSDYTKRYPYVWGDRLGIVLDKGSNAPVQQGLTPPVNNNSGSTGSGNTIDTSGMMVGVGSEYSCFLKADQSIVCWGRYMSVPGGLTGVVQISVGQNHTCALQSDGVVACWGEDNEDGRVSGVLNFSASPGYGEGLQLAISGPSDVTQISAGGYHTCALKSNGTVECTGADWAGQSTPPDGLVNITQISAGGYHTCALKSNGTVECWGEGWDSASMTPPVDLSGVVQISSGGNHACALRSNGTVECWGKQDSIEGEPSSSPVPDGLTGVTQISAGEYHTCALKSNGMVECWGEYWNGDGWSTDVNYVPVSVTNIVQVAAGYTHTCALKSNGSVVCWDMGGALEVPEEIQVFPIILNSIVFDDHRLTNGNNFTCAITSTGGVECWGANDVGQLNIPVGLDNVLEINAGHGFACALKSDGSVVCWGDPWGGQTDVPVGLNSVVQMSVGYNNVCALRSNGTVECWGDNSDEQTDVPNELNHVVQIATGWNFACALKDTGRIQCWGQNYSGVQNPPSDIGTVKQISAGDEHMCAVKTDDSLACWGSNSDLSGTSDVAHVSAGEYYSCLAHVDGSVECGGNNGDGQTDVPMTLSGVTEISTSMGGSHTCALKSDSTIVCWGREVEGQTEVPPAFGGVVFGPIVGPVFEDHTLAAGTNFTCALKSDGTVACWGINTDGQTTVPSGLTDVAQISAGDSHTCALKSDGTVACWGINTDEQTTVPSGLTDVTQVSAGDSHTCALKSDGTVACWGINTDEQTNVPPGLVDVVQVISGGYHTCALKADKTVVCWGSGGGPQSDVPGGLTKVIQLTADADNTCALRENGRVTCWGSMSGDQSLNNVVKVHMGGGTLCVLKSDATVECLGNGIYGQLIVPNISLTVDISVGFSHVCAKNTANEITCWGSNWEGEGDTPSPFGSGFIPENITQISSDEEHLAAGQSHTCAIRSDATVECWGANYQGQSSVPSGLTDVIQVSAGLSHTCALKSDGMVQCWGSNGYNEIDVPTGLSNVTTITSGAVHTCALKSDSTVECWGDTFTSNLVPPGLNHDIVEVTANAWTTCVLQSNGKVHCIGDHPGSYIGVQYMAGLGYYGDVCLLHVDESVTCLQNLPPSGLSNVVKLTTGGNHTCALKSDGTVECWGGWNDDGQLNVPSGLVDVGYIAAGFYHSCAMKSDTTVTCWGQNNYGQTDIPADLEPIIVPSVVYEDTNLSAGTSHTCTIQSGTAMCTGYMDQMENNATQVSAGGTDTCVLKTDGTVACYGITINYSNLDGYEQLDVPAGLNNVVQISSGQGYNCALKSDGTVECWGKYGHIDPTVPSLTDVVSISVAESGYHACALKSDGSVECWGDSYNGVLAIPNGLNAVKQVSAGYGYTCVLKSNGKVSCWGSNANGRSTVPTGLSNVIQISAGGSHACALKSDGSVECWGNNASGQRSIPSGLSGVVDITTGNAHSCALKSDDSIVCWGSNGYSQKDIDNLVNLPTTIPNTVSPIFEEKNISTMHGNSYSSGNFFHACAIESLGTVKCWFDYDNTGYEESYVPVGLTGVVQVLVGNSQDCALKSDGTVMCWRFRQDYTTVTWGPAFPLDSVIQMSGDGNSICALRSDGTLVCWGDNYYGQNTVPPGIEPIKQVSHGGGSICALKSDTTVACWGNNYSGQNNVPSGLTDVVQISHNGASVCALKSDGTVICWGTGNGYGGFGLEPPIGLSDVVQINQSCALKADGMVVCWNKDNSLEGYYQSTPRDYTKKGFTDVIEINGAGICGFKSNLTISCWDDYNQTYIDIHPDFNTTLLNAPIFNQKMAMVESSIHGQIVCSVTNAANIECHIDDSYYNLDYPSIVNAVQITSDGSKFCVLDSSGDVTCWYWTNLFLDTIGFINMSVEAATDVISIVNDCVMKTDNSVFCNIFGSGYYLTDTNIVQTTKSNNRCVLHANGKLSCWQGLSGGMIGGNVKTLPGLDHVKSLSQGMFNRYCAVTGENRKVVCWFNNDSFGNGIPYYDNSTPSLQSVEKVSIGTDHVCALMTNGTVTCWGNNTYGQTNVPVNLQNVIDIATADKSSCAITSDYSRYCWGNNW